MSDFSELVQRMVEALKRDIAVRARPANSTYRLQFHREHMTFRHAAELVAYLNDLGISHLYASPCVKTRAGSQHGYAIVDYGALNPELGDPQDYQAMVDALRQCGLGQILDIVPNHMSAAPGENAWWTDVLENGPSSPYACYFDIDWASVKEELRNKILLPLLGEQYGEVLESGQLHLQYRDGAFFVRCYEAPLPIDPKTYPLVLSQPMQDLKAVLAAESPELLELESILTALEHLPQRDQTDPEQIRERQREKDLIKKRLNQLTSSCPPLAELIEKTLTEWSGAVGDPHSFDKLHRLLDAQVYRLAHWGAAGDEINYRRFFDINELAAVCMEDAAVFEKGHRLVFDMLVRGDVTGLRIDHIDGLFDPKEYLMRLQRGYLRAVGQPVFAALTDSPPGSSAAAGATEEGDAAASWPELEPLVSRSFLEEGQNTPPPLFVVVEKILGPEEPLPKDWLVEGTTGYDFLRCVNGLFVDWSGFQELTRIFDRFVGQHTDFREVVYDSKLSVLRAAMSSDLHLLAQRLNRLSEHQRRFRDFTFNMLRHALREIIACFAVYRTYLRPGEVSDRDRRFVLRAAAQAKRRNPDIAAGAFDFVRDVLLFEQPSPLDAAGQRDRELFVGRFQQVTSPVMAKGVEDTAYYRYFPLSSLNEVGDEPPGRPIRVEDFHRENAARQSDWPASLLCTTTHDTKRSEDVRARINVLSEIPREWGRKVNRWASLNRRHRREVDGSPAPCRADEYLLYQTMVGVWPLEDPTPDGHGALVARLQTYMEKATREAKVHTSWVNPNAEYDAAVREFIATVLDDRPKNRFLTEFRAFHQHIVRWGLYNALAQVLLKLTSPGVPDIYQGQELWDFSLVDPDNRRPVDFALRRRLLAELQSELRPGEGMSGGLSQFSSDENGTVPFGSAPALGRTDAAWVALARRLAENPFDPRLKLFVTWQALRFRREHSYFFRHGQYVPIAAEGEKAAHVCAFAWRWKAEGESLPRHAVVVVPRWLARLAQSGDPASERPVVPVGELVWGDTRLTLPDSMAAPLRNLYTGRRSPPNGSALRMANILCDFPVALLTDRD
jgi:(1->4)-alpha-D-glucan 1-alpha-D-glucosylmutase